MIFLLPITQSEGSGHTFNCYTLPMKKIEERQNIPCYYRVSVKGLVRDSDGRILLAKEDNGMWDLIGGGLEHNEDPVDGLKREIMEETGLEVSHVSSSPKYFLTADRYGHDDFTANIIYEVKLKNLNFVPSDECQELRYFTLRDIKDTILYPNVTKLIDIL